MAREGVVVDEYAQRNNPGRSRGYLGGDCRPGVVSPLALNAPYFIFLRKYFWASSLRALPGVKRG